MEKVNFAVITPTYNRGDGYLLDCIESVRYQRRVDGLPYDYVHIIVNDNSIDNTYDLLESEKRKDPRLVVIHSESNKGQGYSTRIAYYEATDVTERWTLQDLKHTRAIQEVVYVVPLDDDDRLVFDALSRYVVGARYCVATQGIAPAMMFGYASFIDSEGNPSQNTIDIDYNAIKYSQNVELFYERMRTSNEVPWSPALRSDLLTEVGTPQNIDKYTCQDWALAMTVLRVAATNHLPCLMLPTIISEHRQHPKQLSRINRYNGTWARNADMIQEDFPSLLLPDDNPGVLRQWNGITREMQKYGLLH